MSTYNRIYREKSLYKLTRNTDSSPEHYTTSDELDMILDMNHQIDSIEFGPLKHKNLSVLIWQSNSSTRLYFDSCIETIHFVEFIMDTCDVNDTGIIYKDVTAYSYNQLEINDRWSVNFGKELLDYNLMNEMIQDGLRRFFSEFDGDQKVSIADRVEKWKEGTRWYHQVVSR